MAAASTASSGAASASNLAVAAAEIAAAQASMLDGLAKRLKVVVFDFDLTVLKIHSWGEGIAVADVDKRDWKNDFADLELFTSVCRQLRERGIHVAIASFGSCPVITRYLELAFGDDLSTVIPAGLISTPSSVGGTDGTTIPDGKNTQIEHILSTLGLDGVDPKSVMLFEDDYRNCQLAHSKGYVSFHCPKHFVRQSWDVACSGYIDHFVSKDTTATA